MALVLKDKDTTIGELCDEIRVEVVGGRRQPEGELSWSSFFGHKDKDMLFL